MTNRGSTDRERDVEVVVVIALVVLGENAMADVREAVRWALCGLHASTAGDVGAAAVRGRMPPSAAVVVPCCTRG